jgi:hypothetical protein
MTEFAEFELLEWIDAERVCLVQPPAPRRRSASRLVKDVLSKVSTATALMLCATSAATAADAACTAPFADTPSAIAIAGPTSRSFTSSEGDVDPRTWGLVLERMKSMHHVEAPRDFDGEPEPFI